MWKINKNNYLELKCKQSSSVIKPERIAVHVESVFLQALPQTLLMFVAQLVAHSVQCFFHAFFMWWPRESGDEHTGAFIEIIDQPKCTDENIECRSRAPAYRAIRTCDLEGKDGEERERRWAEPPTKDRPRICKRSFQLTATMARCIGRCAANSKPIRRVHARKSSTSSAPNTSHWTDLIPRDRAVRTDIYRSGYLRRNCAMRAQRDCILHKRTFATNNMVAR